MKPYDKYKDSGVEWLGEVPEHWEAIKLKYIIEDLESGVSVNATDVPCLDDGYGILKTSCVYTYSFDPNENKEIWNSELPRAKVNPRKDSLIISRMNTPQLVGASGYVGKDYPNLFLPDRLWQTVFRKTINIHVKWLSFVVISNAFRGLLSVLATGTSASMKNISKDDLLNQEVPFPPLEEQQHIAAFLDSRTAQIDVLVNKKRRMIALLQEERAAVVNRAVTKGLDPSVKMKDSGVEWIGEVPEHWTVQQLKYVITFQRGHDLPIQDREEGDIPIVSSGGITGTHSVAQARSPGIVTGRYGTIGDFHLVEEDYWPLNTTLYSINLWNNEARFVWYFLHQLSDLFVLNSKKSAVPGVNRNDLHPTQIAIPANVKEQKSIVSYLDEKTSQIDTTISQAEKQIELLQEYRTALISEVVTGKVDVRGEGVAL